MTNNDRHVAAFITIVVVTIVSIAGVIMTAERGSRDIQKDMHAATRQRQHEAAAERAKSVLQVVRTTAMMPFDDPHDGAWSDAPAAEIAVLPQMMTMPVLDTPSVTDVKLQAMTDGRRIAFRLSWTDATVDTNVDAARFCDAAAIQFPMVDGAPFTMGVRGVKVQIVHWKAVWQKDIDEHFQDVQDVHPNYWADLYWFAKPAQPEGAGVAKYRVPESFDDTASHQWFVALSAGNPMATWSRREPVEELVAEGFGTLTTQAASASTGRGQWKDGRWAIVFARPLKTDDPLDYQFAPGMSPQIGVAIWDGSAGNVGGRKHWSNWVAFEFQR